MKVRVKFRKYGNVRFIGHLDVQRYFQKCVRRAALDVVYTTGFSPHQVMSFAAPLGVGLESNGEYMDMELNTFPGSEKAKNRLNAAGVEGIEVISVKVLPENAGNAMASVAAAEYTVRFRVGREPSFDLNEAISRFHASESALITKETKRSTAEIDIKPSVYKLYNDESGIHMLIDASSAGNIKPGLVMEVLYSYYDEEIKPNALMITREETYTDIGTEEERKLVPLDEIGDFV